MKFKTVLIAVLAASTWLSSCNAPQNSETKVDLEDDLQKVSYSIGVDIGNSFKQQNLDMVDPDILAQGIKDVLKDAGKLSSEEASMAIQTYFQKIQEEKATANLNEGIRFLEANKQKDGVQITPSGLQYKVIKEGEGKSPTLEDKVVAHYHGTLINGEVFDSSVERGEPASFQVNGVIQGWQEALQLMKVGSKWELYIPANLAYGERSAGNIQPNSTLIFEVELLEIQ